MHPLFYQNSHFSNFNNDPIRSRVDLKNPSFQNSILQYMMQRPRSETSSTRRRSLARCWRGKSHESGKKHLSQVSRRDSISLNRWLVYRLQLLNHRVSSSSSCRHRDHNLFRFFRLARRLSIFLFSITSVRARHPQDLRRRSSLPTGNSLEYRPTPLLLSFDRTTFPSPLTKLVATCSFNEISDSIRIVESKLVHILFLSSSTRSLFGLSFVID